MQDFETHPVGTAARIAGKTIADWIEFARRDDCLDYMVPSDLRQVISALTRANAATAAACEAAKGVRDSRNHFEQKAASQKSRVTRLRHRQRALISALEAIRSTTSLADAKFQANIAIGGWADENLIFDARALATPDQTAALDKLIAEAEARVWDEAVQIVADFPIGGDGPVGNDRVVWALENVRNAILAASKKGGA